MASPPFLPDETKPGASDLISLFPSVEQTFRDVIEDWILAEHNTTGTHKQVTLDDIAEPTIAADLVGIWHESGVLKTRFATGDVFDLLTSNTGMPLAGGTMTGDLVLAGAPDADLKAATKKYVDDADVLKANLASPALTGNPTTPTQAAGNNSTRIASTAFVQGAAALPNYIHVRHQTTSAVGGGNTTSGSRETRVFATIMHNNISGAGLTSGEVTGLVAGDYRYEYHGFSNGDDGIAIWLRDVTGAADLDSGGSKSSSTINTLIALEGKFTLGTTSTVRIEQRVASSRSSGFGAAHNIAGANNVYAELFIWEV